MTRRRFLLFCLLLLFVSQLAVQLLRFYNQANEPHPILNQSQQVIQKNSGEENRHVYSNDWDLDAKKTYWIDAYKGSPRKNLLVYVPRPGGFGNVVRGLLTSYYLAVKSGRHLAVERSSKYDLSAVFNFSTGAPFFYDGSNPSEPPVEVFMDKHSTSSDFRKVKSVVNTSLLPLRIYRVFSSE